MIINGTEITVKDIPDITEAEIQSYIGHIHREHPGEQVVKLDISRAPNGKIALDYTLQPPKFHRIRRITGYLVGTLDRFNNAKRAEVHDRVKHTTPGQEADYVREE